MASKAAIIFASLAATAYLAAAPSAEAMDPGFYVGGFYGSLERSNSKSKDTARLAEISRDLYADLAFDTVSQSPSLSFDDESFGFLGGYRWTPNLAFELGYVQLGKLKYRSEDVLADLLETPPLVGTVSSRFTSKVTAFTISALGIWPLTYEWEVFGRAGIAFTGTKARIRIEDSSFGESDDSIEFVAGAGLSYTFLDVYTVRAEWQRVFDAGKNSLGSAADVDLLSVGFVVSF
jgi:opacity protein-like surface antigen